MLVVILVDFVCLLVCCLILLLTVVGLRYDLVVLGGLFVSGCVSWCFGLMFTVVICLFATVFVGYLLLLFCLFVFECLYLNVFGLMTLGGYYLDMCLMV